MKRIFKTLLIVLLTHSTLLSQNVSLTEGGAGEAKPWKGELLLGFGSYEGDVLCHSEENINLFTEANFAFGLKVKKEIGANVDMMFSYYNTKLTGNDALFTSVKGHQIRGFSFANQINEFTIGMTYEPLRSKGYRFSPYVYGSLGLVLGTSDTDYRRGTKDQPLVRLIDEDIEGTSSSSFVLPLGIGVLYNVSDKLFLSLEGGLRFALNDYIDGVSSSGNSEVNDYYGIGGLSIGYYLNTGNQRFRNTIKEY